MYKPEKKNIAFHAEKQWDGMNNGYASIQKCGDEYRFYYRADSSVLNAEGKYQRSVAPMFCMATSKDAITFIHLNSTDFKQQIKALFQPIILSSVKITLFKFIMQA